MGEAKRDANSITTLLGVSSADGATPVTLYVDPVTHRLLVDLPAGSDGTVTSVSVVTANGVSGSVATATTTPAITITLGDITPTSVAVSTWTASEIVATDANKKLQTLAVATYPSLTELSYIKGLTSAIQTQLGTKAPATAPTFATSITGSYLTASELLGTGASKEIVSLAVATYPSLTEISYVKGVTSAIQTQISARLPLAGGTMTGKIVSSGSSEVGKTYTPATGAQTVALDCALNNIHHVTGHADGTAITFTVANATNSQCFIVSILQGAVVSTIAGWFATVRWAGGSAPTLTASANKRDTFGFIRTGANTYDGFIIGQNC